MIPPANDPTRNNSSRLLSIFSRSRRHFLRSAGFGSFGTIVALALDQSWQSKSVAAHSSPENPLSAKPSHFPNKIRSVIFLFLVGGPSQIDTWDYKPDLKDLHGKPVPDSYKEALANSKFANVFHGCKDQIMASPYRWQQHGQSGLWVSELFPHLARQADELCVIHSMQAESNNHAPASYQLHTGDIRAGKASIGSWITYGLGSENEDLPGYVMLFDAGPLGGASNYTNGFLPPAYQPTRLRDQGSVVLHLEPPERFRADQRATLDLIEQLNHEHRSTRPSFSELDARMASYELAYRMQSAGLEVGDLQKETAATHSLYGLDHSDPRTQSFGRKCLLARRLVERGVRFVQLYDMPDKDGWDAHDRLEKNHTPRARWTDQPMAALVKDLKQRGLLESTLVVCASEFGRTPMMQGDQGRQHNAAGFTIWLAGGGIKKGFRLGSTDELGLMAVEHPVPFSDLHATILHLLGIEHEKLFFDVNGRQERLTGVAGSAKVIREILA
jgi:hypothetical protein